MGTIVFILLGAAIAAIAAVALASWVPLLRTASLRQPEDGTGTPMISVVAYAPCDLPETERWLEMAMSQDYPDYEVIVVTQTSAEGSRMMADYFLPRYNRLRFTFINPEARGLSRRKLALTLGIKAAEGDVVLTTSTYAEIPSVRWLSEMAAPFACENTVLALGIARPGFLNMNVLTRPYRKYLWISTTSRWISSAMKGNAYRGHGDNLAFRRKIFFDHKGYADSLLLKYGDDDMFVNSVSHDGATTVILSPDSILQEAHGSGTSLLWQEDREQHRFTSRFLPSGPAYRAGAASLGRWIVFGCCVATALISPLPLSLTLSACLLLLFCIAEAIVFSRASKRLMAPGAALLAPFFSLWHPIGNLLFGMRCRNRRCFNYS